MNPILIDKLTECSLFKGISSSELIDLYKKYGFPLQKYFSDNVVALMGEKCTHLMILVKGSVKGEMIDDSGKLIKIEDIVAPNPIAHAFLFAQKNNLPVTITATEETEIVFIEKQIFLSMLQENMFLLQNFLTLISDRSLFLSQKIFMLSLKNLKNKLCIFILKRATEQKSHNITLTETQQELADYFGVARPSLARSLTGLEEIGVIKIDKKNITILDIEKLKQLAV